MTLLEHKVPDWFPASMVALGVNFQRSRIELAEGFVENGPANLIIGFDNNGEKAELSVEAQITINGVNCPEGFVESMYSFAYSCFDRDLKLEGEVPS